MPTLPLISLAWLIATASGQYVSSGSVNRSSYDDDTNQTDDLSDDIDTSSIRGHDAENDIENDTYYADDDADEDNNGSTSSIKNPENCSFFLQKDRVYRDLIFSARLCHIP